MSTDDLAERLDAVERRLDAAYPEPQDGSDDTTERIESFAERLADLEAAVEAVEGYVGEIERVDGELERRADAALATADRLEDRLDAVEERLTDGSIAAAPPPTAGTTALGQPADGGHDTAATEPGSVHDGPQRLAGSKPGGTATGGESLATADEAGTATDRQRTDCTCDRAPHQTGAAERDPGPGAPPRSAADGGTDRVRRRSAPETPAVESDVGGSGVGGGSDDVSRSDEVGGNGDLGGGSDGVGRSGPSRRPDEPRRPPSSGPAGATPTRSPGGTGQSENAGEGHGEPFQRADDGTTVSGWGEATADAVHDDGSSTRGGQPPTEDEDGRWSSGGTETLLDRLRALL